MKFTFIKSVTILFSVVLAGSGLHAQEKGSGPTSLSLKQAVEYAVQNSVSTRNATIDLELAKKKIWETTAIGLPQLSAQANYQHLFTVPELSLGGITFLDTELPDGTPITAGDISNGNVFLGFEPSAPIQLGVKDNTTLDLTLTQLVFSGEYLVGLQASRVYYQMADQSQQKAVVEIKELVANTYSMVLMLQQTHDKLKMSLTNVNLTLGEMREMLNQGLIENTDVDQLELTSLNITSTVNAIERQVTSATNLLKFQMGMPLETQILLTDDIEILASASNLESISGARFDLNRNIDLQILTTQEKLGELNLKREKSTYLPNLAAVYRHSEKVNQPAFDFTPKDVFQLSLNIPVFSSGQRMVKVQQRKMELDKVTNLRANVSQGLILEFETSKNNLQTAYEDYLNNKRNIELTNRIYEKTLIKYKEGLSSSMDLTNAQNQYLTAQTNYYKAVYALIQAKNKLDKLNNNL
ncbi:MAG: TolC family protein [Bacteroidales bacterium]|jgi:outer membrane protein TolC|nr:TolC family protein [Bacteroidales bacterium]